MQRLQRTISEVIFDMVCLFLGFWALQVAFTGYWSRPLGPGLRMVFAVISALAIYATVGSYAAGLGYLAGAGLAAAGLFLSLRRGAAMAA